MYNKTKIPVKISSLISVSDKSKNQKDPNEIKETITKCINDIKEISKAMTYIESQGGGSLLEKRKKY